MSTLTAALERVERASIQSGRGHKLSAIAPIGGREMLPKCIATAPAEVVDAGETQFPTPSRRRINLKTVSQVRREMSHVYREMRAGAIESQEGTRYVYVLGQIGKMVELAELERRIESLEGEHGNQS